MYIGKLQHGGGSDDAPAALVNLLRVAQNQVGLRVSTARQLLSPLDEDLPDYPLLFVHGRRSFQWSPPERQAIAAVFEVTVDDIAWGHKTPIQHIYGHGPG